jgi:hypothetical protein
LEFNSEFIAAFTAECQFEIPNDRITISVHITVSLLYRLPPCLDVSKYKVNELATESKNKNIRDMQRGINEFK